MRKTDTITLTTTTTTTTTTVASTISIVIPAPDRCDIVVQEALPSTASRINPDVTGKAPYVSKGSSMTRLISPRDNRKKDCESTPETNFCLLCIADLNIVEIQDQARSIYWIDHLGAVRKHTFDFRIRRRDGRWVAVVVKPKRIADKPEFQAEFERIVRWTPFSFAHEVLLITEMDMPQWAIRNARLIRSCLLDPISDLDQQVDRFAAKLEHPTKIRALCDWFGGPPIAFRPVIRLVYRGVLKPVAPGLISPETVVTYQGDTK